MIFINSDFLEKLQIEVKITVPRELLHSQSYDTSFKLVSKDCIRVSNDHLFQEHKTFPRNSSREK